MSAIAIAVKHLMAAGVTGDALKAAVEDLVVSSDLDGIEGMKVIVDDLRAVDCPSDAIATGVMALATNGARHTAAWRRAERERAARYRARRSLSDNEWHALRNTVIARDGYVCRYCDASTDTPHCDHVVPLARGGTNDLSNLAIACPQCNASKQDKLLSEWSPPAGGWI